jgi:hypothetical protein
MSNLLTPASPTRQQSDNRRGAVGHPGIGFVVDRRDGGRRLIDMCWSENRTLAGSALVARAGGVVAGWVKACGESC